MEIRGSRLLRFLGLSLFLHLLLLSPLFSPIFFQASDRLEPPGEELILVRVPDEPWPRGGQLSTAPAASAFSSPAQDPSELQGLAPSPGRVKASPSNPAAPRKPPGVQAGPLDLGEGGPARERTISLESPSFPYAPYLASVRRKIERLWGYPAEARARGVTGELLVGFTILNDGRLSRLDLVKTSGSSILDEAALRAIQQAAPYAPFPKQIDLDRLHITASFLYYHSPVPQKGGP